MLPVGQRRDLIEVRSEGKEVRIAADHQARRTVLRKLSHLRGVSACIPVRMRWFVPSSETIRTSTAVPHSSSQ